MSPHSMGLLIALIAGIVTTGLWNQLGHAGDWSSPAKYFEAEGFPFGFAAALLAYGTTRLLTALLRIRLATLAIGIVLVLVGLVTFWWIVWWGVPPLTLEGAWLWPLAIVPLVLAVFTLRRWVRLRAS